MRGRFFICFTVAAAVVGAVLPPLTASAGGLDYLWFHHDPPTLADVARMIDCIHEKLLNQGTVVVKQPDIWSQARMTMFRKEFEETMQLELNKFEPTLAARIARSDAASLQSQTAIAAVLTPFGSATPGGTPFSPTITSPEQFNAAVSSTLGFVQTQGSGATPSTINVPPSPLAPTASGGAPVQTFGLLNQVTPGASGTTVSPLSGLNIGLEPNVKLDEKSDYISHLHRIRRVNLGDDNADSAGYGLYLMRVPISIQPGDCTKKGWGAIANMTVRPDFGPRFLPATYRNLVINDLVDQLTPVVHELIRSGLTHDQSVNPPSGSGTNGTGSQANQPDLSVLALPDSGRNGTGSQKNNAKTPSPAVPYTTSSVVSVIKRATPLLHPMNRLGPRTYAIAPSDLDRIFIADNIVHLAKNTEDALDLHNLNPKKGASDGSDDLHALARSTDVRAYLRAELESAYDLMEGRCKEDQPLLQDVDYIDSLADQVYCRKYEGLKGTGPGSKAETNEFERLYYEFTQRLPGNLHDRTIGVLCWGIAIEAGLLNRQLHEDMKQTKGLNDYACPEEVDQMPFFVPYPIPEVEAAFEAYVKARWPMITFAIEPVVEEQNIEDSLTLRRDLQLAVAFAFSAGRISFRQLLQYNRQLQYEAQTIKLNQTVAAFAHGNDTFGWRITPRYQTPPSESNPRAIVDLLWHGGPGPNWVLDNSKIEPGLRELTAVVIMPSFVRGMRLDVSSDWFRLHDPDERKLHTARTVEIGRQINEARDCLEEACKCGKYRPEDVERLRVRLHQLEAMLPMQTQFVKVPYENTLGGFALFTQGLTALVPELLGYEGLQSLQIDKDGNFSGGDIIVYGKHFNIYESEVVVGGLTLPREGTGTTFATDSKGNPTSVVSSLSPLHDPAGNLVLLNTATGTVVANIKDMGSYNVQSREVMRVRIPSSKLVQTTTRGDGSKVVELYVSTPNGISNRLLIPVTTPPKPAPPVTFSSIKCPSYVLANQNLVIKVNATLGDGQLYKIGDPKAFPQDAFLKIKPVDDRPPEPTPVSLQLTFPYKATTVLEPIQIEIPKPEADGTITLKAKQLNDLAKQIVSRITDTGLVITPNAVIVTSSILLQPGLDEKHEVPHCYSTTNQLAVAFEFVIQPPAKGTAANPAATSPAPPKPTTASSASTTASAAALDASALWPKGYSKGIVPAQGLVAGKDESQKASFPFTSRSFDPAARKTSADSEEFRSFPLLFDPDQESRSVIRAQGPSSQPVTPPVASPPVVPAGTTIPIPGINQPVTIPNPTTLVVPNATPAQTAQSLVVVPRSPSVNVSVPVTNNLAPPKHAGGLFHRHRNPGTPQNPTRPPLLERLIGGR